MLSAFSLFNFSALSLPSRLLSFIFHFIGVFLFPLQTTNECFRYLDSLQFNYAIKLICSFKFEFLLS